MFLPDTSIAQLKMVGHHHYIRLNKLGIKTIRDLLNHIPFRYENYSLISKITDVQEGETVTIIGYIKSFNNAYTKSGKKIQKAIIADETGFLEVIWYNQAYLTKILRPNFKISLAGKIKYYGSKKIIESPIYEILNQFLDNYNKGDQMNLQSLVHTGRLVPIYPETEGISSKWLRSKLNTVLNKLKIPIKDYIPSDIRSKYELLSLFEAYHKIHFPLNTKDIFEAKRRLAFDELLLMQMIGLKRKKNRSSKQSIKILTSKYQDKIDQFIRTLPYKLTKSQIRCINEIIDDLQKETPMNRLLEGDVGSGKTVVAIVAILLVFLNGYKSIYVAPTEILVKQHFKTLTTYLRSWGIKIAILTSSEKKIDSDCHVIVGTHAVIFNSLHLSDVALVIIDEQQRFGVEQRAAFRNLGHNPHLLTMTATPIPRTIALTFYADLDLSNIEEMPLGRKLVKTWIVPPEKRYDAYNWIKKQLVTDDNEFKKINKKIIKHKVFKQAFIICPLIDESETLQSIKSVKKEFINLQINIFPDLRLGLLHGRLAGKDKAKILIDFKKKKFHILVATPIVEVGIDIPNAMIIMIESADRFGIAQLHQLRGRVGRNESQSYCLLFSDNTNILSSNRLKLLEKYHSGPKLAEMDFRLRGPGEIYGLKQHGKSNLLFADIDDFKLITESKEVAQILLSNENLLSQDAYLHQLIQNYTINNIDLS